MRHSSITIKADTYTSILPEVASGLPEAMAALVPGMWCAELAGSFRAPKAAQAPADSRLAVVSAGQNGWRAWGSNPEPTD
jgi:hypothetical protein